LLIAKRELEERGSIVRHRVILLMYERNLKRSSGQRLEAQGGRQARRTKRCSGKNRSTPLPNIPPHFEIKVTAEGVRPFVT
jgi:hypothetical protein